MPRAYSVWDTNVYRNLGAAAFASLRDKERQRSVIGIASFYAVVELCAHLADPSDPQAPSCLASIKRLWTHCSTYNGYKQVLNITGDRESIVALVAFGRSVPESAKAAEAFATLAAKANAAATLADLAANAEWFRAAAADSAQAKGDWRDAILRGRKAQAAFGASTPADASGDPLAAFRAAILRGDGRHTLARSIAELSARTLGITPTDAELVAATDRVLDACAVPIHYYDSVVLKELAGTYDALRPERLSAGFDYLACYMAAPIGTQDGGRFRLISEDADIRAAGRLAGMEGHVLSLAEYDRLLASGTDADIETP